MNHTLIKTDSIKNNEGHHDSVLLDETLKSLDILPNDTVVDATIGGGGHFARIISALSSEGVAIGIDADEDAVCRGRIIAEKASPSVYVERGNFRNLAAILDGLHIAEIDKVLFDLGWSGFQLTSGRGFSFQREEPLLMSYDTESLAGAAQLVNTASEERLADILYTYGEERFARRIAHAIVAARRHKRILTTGDLVSAVLAGTPSWYQHRHIHSATKTFQALRIAVNDELEALREGLSIALDRTRSGGRVAVITFHSIEDRIVKTIFREAARAGIGTQLTRKPIAPSAMEVVQNPRSRSAKLRVFVRDVNHSASAYS